MDNQFYVYLHNRLITGAPFYIGKGKLGRAYSKRGRNLYWNKIVKKDDGFNVTLLANNIDEELAVLTEIEAIDLYKMRGINLCNVTNGGEGTSGLKHTQATKDKLSKILKGKVPWNKGIAASQQAKDKMSKTRKGRIALNKGKNHSEETKNKMSAVRKGRTALNKGKFVSEETKKKISEANKGNVAWNKGLKYSQISLQTGMKNG